MSEFFDFSRQIQSFSFWSTTIIFYFSLELCISVTFLIDKLKFSNWKAITSVASIEFFKSFRFSLFCALTNRFWALLSFGFKCIFRRRTNSESGGARRMTETFSKEITSMESSPSVSGRRISGMSKTAWKGIIHKVKRSSEFEDWLEYLHSFREEVKSICEIKELTNGTNWVPKEGK